MLIPSELNKLSDELLVERIDRHIKEIPQRVFRAKLYALIGVIVLALGVMNGLLLKTWALYGVLALVLALQSLTEVRVSLLFREYVKRTKS